jgi:chromosome segregation ATPase
MKTVFEGIVNGQKFDNVADYNAALTRAIQAGNVIQASSKTYTEEEPVTKVEIKPKRELPNYYIGMNQDNYYMDMMTGNAETDEHSLDRCRETLQETYNEVVETLEEMTDDNLSTYSSNLNKILTKLKSDRSTNNKMLDQFNHDIDELNHNIDVLTKKIEEIEPKLSLCESCGDLNLEMIEYYSSLIDVVQNEINNRHNNSCNDCDTQQHEIVAVPHTKFSEAQAQQEILLDGVKKLLAEIFNK